MLGNLFGPFLSLAVPNTPASAALCTHSARPSPLLMHLCMHGMRGTEPGDTGLGPKARRRLNFPFRRHHNEKGQWPGDDSLLPDDIQVSE